MCFSSIDLQNVVFHVLGTYEHFHISRLIKKLSSTGIQSSFYYTTRISNFSRVVCSSFRLVTTCSCCRSQEWFSDGTFSTAPLLFEQLYTLHVVQYNTVVPVVYALLSNKTRDTYTKFIHALKILQPGLRPQQLMCDFEQAALQAFSNEFPGIQTTGCFFHLSQSVWRRVQTEGLKVSPLL